MTAVSLVEQQRRAVAAEWTRLWTVRTTWWCAAAATVVMLGMGALLARDVTEEAGPLPPAHEAGQLALLLGQAALIALVVLAVTGEHGTGAIVSTLQWTARRRHLLVARVLVPVGVATVLGTLLALATDLVAVAVLPALRLDPGGTARSLLVVAGVVAATALVSVGTALLLRTTAAALSVALMVCLVLPALLPGLGNALLADVAELLPGTGTVFALLGEPSDLGASHAVGLLVTWSVAALAGGSWSLLRRDAG